MTSQPEILTDRYPPPPVRIFAIPSTHEAIPIFQGVQNSLLEELRKSQTDFSLGLFLRGRELQCAQPTIFIVLKNWTDESAMEGLKSVVTFLTDELPKYISDSDTDLYNIREDMLTEVHQTLYLFTFD